MTKVLRRLAEENGRIEVIGVSPALAAALTPFDLPDGVTVTDTQRRRWAG